jgi:hypothetical protein
VVGRLGGRGGECGVGWRSGEVGGEGGGAVVEEEGGVGAFEVLPLCGGREGGAEDGGASGGVVGCDVAVWGWEGGYGVFFLLCDVRLRSGLEWGGRRKCFWASARAGVVELLYVDRMLLDWWYAAGLAGL